MPATVIGKWQATGASNEVYIGRGSKWGNPFSHKNGTRANVVVASREEAIAAFRNYLLNNHKLMKNLHELQDKVLVCYCHPQPCHGDVLAELINRRESNGYRST